MGFKMALLLKVVSTYLVVTICSPDSFVLQQMKLEFDDPTGALNGWDEKHGSPCNWTGITCDENTNRVVEINLSGMNLSGPFSAVVGKLSALKKLSLAINNINGSIPRELARCSQLQYLDLQQNSLTGSLPHFISKFRQLKYLDLSSNNLGGSITPGFGKLPELRVLRLVGNSVSGRIPPYLAKLSNLEDLSLAYNPFTGSLPAELGNLSRLKNLWLANCNLVGEIPNTIGNLVELQNLDFSTNKLRGSIPESIANLENVVQIELWQNNLSGRIPVGMGKLKALRRFDAAMNHLDGSIPAGFGGLESLNLYENNLVGEIPSEIGLSRNLQVLKLFSNRLAGSLPESIGRYSSLRMLDVADNQLSGRLPRDVCKNKALRLLCLFDNYFNGTLPESLGVCDSLTAIWISNNKFTGEVPPKYWELPNISFLQLSNNKLEGIIPAGIAHAKNLLRIDISNNKFSGILPPEIGKLWKLITIVASNNSFSGTVPATLGNLIKLETLELHNNHFTGELPQEIGSWGLITELNLARNHFSGPIPVKLAQLLALTHLDLSDNMLTGVIPAELGNLKLSMFNISYNRLYGPLPAAFENSVFENSFLGNPGLCSNKRLKWIMSCTEREREKNRNWWVLLCLLVLGSLMFVIGLSWIYKRYGHFGKAEGEDSTDKSSWIITRFQTMGFNTDEILDCLNEESVIGTGGAGKVYRALLSNGETVAVKKLWNRTGSTNDGFEAELRALVNVRHTNIVKLLCCCSNTDSKLLVYEYMPNGSLGDILHGPNASVLDWPMRYKIALGAAKGIAYLHHDCSPPIVHRDVKSNNILLDQDFNAHLGDFGLAKILQSCGNGPDSMSAIAGTYGYIPPEYAYTLRVNEKGDVYSFGVVLLELLTGKRPLDGGFGDDEDLVKWVRRRIEENDGLQDVLDPNVAEHFKGEMDTALKVALLCANTLPVNRPPMRVVVEMLWTIRHTPITSPISRMEN